MFTIHLSIHFIHPLSIVPLLSEMTMQKQLLPHYFIYLCIYWKCINHLIVVVFLLSGDAYYVEVGWVEREIGRVALTM
jgi:hypothetical protein